MDPRTQELNDVASNGTVSNSVRTSVTKINSINKDYPVIGSGHKEATSIDQTTLQFESNQPSLNIDPIEQDGRDLVASLTGRYESKEGPDLYRNDIAAIQVLNTKNQNVLNTAYRLAAGIDHATTSARVCALLRHAGAVDSDAESRLKLKPNVIAEIEARLSLYDLDENISQLSSNVDNESTKIKSRAAELIAAINEEKDDIAANAIILNYAVIPRQGVVKYAVTGEQILTSYHYVTKDKSTAFVHFTKLQSKSGGKLTSAYLIESCNLPADTTLGTVQSILTSTPIYVPRPIAENSSNLSADHLGSLNEPDQLEDRSLNDEDKHEDTQPVPATTTTINLSLNELRARRDRFFSRITTPDGHNLDRQNTPDPNIANNQPTDGDLTPRII